jgi:hypothetical protein
MEPPVCCKKPMRFVGPLPIEEGGKQRTFRLWYCTACNKQMTTAEPVRKPSEYERSR